MKLLNRIIRNNISFERIAEEWLVFKKRSIKESTFFRYQYTIQTYLIKNFKYMKLKELKKYDFNNYIENLYTNLSEKTVLDIITILKSILKYCERKYDIDFKLDLISNLKKSKGEIQILTNNELQTLEEYCLASSDLRSIGILICLYTGMRIGELCALKWRDINLKNREISINKTMQRIYIKGDGSFVNVGTPKSQKSTRNIPIANKIVKILKEIQRKNKFSGEAYFLTGNVNNYIEPRNLQYHFKNVLNKCKISNYNFHVLRHTFASHCIQAGIDAKSLSEILGHNSVDITLNRYVHSSLKVKSIFLDRL